MKTSAVAIMLLGIAMVWLGVSGAETGLEDKLWMIASIIGVLFMILGRLLYQYGIYLRQERAKKSIRYRRYVEMQNKIRA